MAYAATITTTRYTVSRRRYFLVTIEEEDAAAASEATIPGTDIPAVGTIVSVKATLGAGAGATIDPICGRVTGGGATTNDAVYANGGAAAHIDSAPLSTFVRPSGESLYWLSGVNAGTDNTISTQILIVEGYIS